MEPEVSSHPALGIDHGDARIGIAATDPLGILAHPVETIEVRAADPVERIAALVTERNIRTLVLGLPLNLDGIEGPAAAKVRAFGKKLAARLPGLPLVHIDESHTTTAAAAKLRQAGRSARRQKSVIDQAAAVEILQLWMSEIQENHTRTLGDGATPDRPSAPASNRRIPNG